MDEKLACQAMCACGQYNSPVFDPYETPGLGPILRVKYCTVPVTAKTFSNGMYVYSIESIFKELYAIIDSLERSGEL